MVTSGVTRSEGRAEDSGDTALAGVIKGNCPCDLSCNRSEAFVSEIESGVPLAKSDKVVGVDFEGDDVNFEPLEAVLDRLCED